MELNIVNPLAGSYNESIGISEERSNELSDKLDDLVRNYAKPGQLIRLCDFVNEIIILCSNLEEVTYCLINHWEYRRFHNWASTVPPKKK